MKTYKKGEHIQCPHCGSTLEDPVEDWALVNQVGKPCTDNCHECQMALTVTDGGGGLFDVEKAYD